MAIYHFTAKVISRARGRSALAAAAYRSASIFTDQLRGPSFDYSDKSGVVHFEILRSDGAPEWMKNREVLWNAVEAAELRRDAQVAREVELAPSLDGFPRVFCYLTVLAASRGPWKFTALRRDPPSIMIAAAPTVRSIFFSSKTPYSLIQSAQPPSLPENATADIRALELGIENNQRKIERKKRQLAEIEATIC